MCGEAYSPPRRGGVARSAGVVSLVRTFRRSSIEASCRARASRLPVCAFAPLGAASLDASPYRARASRPPLGGGEF